VEKKRQIIKRAYPFMAAILSQAQALVSELQALMLSIYQQGSLQALLVILEGQGISSEYCQTKSASF